MKSFFKRMFCSHIDDTLERKYHGKYLDCNKGLRFYRFRTIMKCRKCGRERQIWEREYFLNGGH
jgi:hypothetical protein